MKQLNAIDRQEYRDFLRTFRPLAQPARYTQWRKAVILSDLMACTWCGKPGEIDTLHVDHIKPWARYPELRYEVSNGRTLCKSCHQQRHRGIDHPEFEARMFRIRKKFSRRSVLREALKALQEIERTLRRIEERTP